MRLDIFIPFLKKPKRGTEPAPDALPLRLAKRVLPRALFADRATGKPGLARKWLKWIGPSWQSAPVRRLCQSACLGLFLWLFFYVCYPYSARPALVSAGWQPAAIDADSHITLAGSALSGGRFAPGETIYAARDAGPQTAQLGRVTIVRQQPGTLIVRPAESFPPDVIEELQFDLGGAWTLSELPADAWPSHYADNLAGKEWLHAESLLIIDPLVAISTAIASRTWVWSLVSAAGILLVAVFVPRGFCGYICPLGTLIDLFDWSIGKRIVRFRVADDGWWVHIKYYLPAGTLLCSLAGVLVSGFVAAIPVITRGMLFLFDPLQVAWARGSHNVPPVGPGQWLSLALFFAVLGLGLLKPRFWCKYVCPSGAVF
jgi:hypothetical protein